MPLRICHIAYTFYENDNRVIRYVDAMVAQGAVVDVIALRRKGQSRCDTSSQNPRVCRIQERVVNENKPMSYLLKILLFLIRSSVVVSIRHLYRPYDVLHIHNVPDFLVFAAWLPKLMGAKIFLDIHDMLPELFSGKFGTSKDSFVFRCLLSIERMSCGFADHVIAANDIWLERLISRSVSEIKCTSILNYPDLSRFKPLSKSEKQKSGKFIFLYPGSLNHHQGLDIAINAFARVKNELPGAEFHIYGEGPDWMLLECLIAQQDLSDRVFLHPLLPVEEISKLMARADLGIIPKRADGFGNEAFSTKTLEFMACGVPIIVSGTRIDRYYFDDSLVVFFESGDEKALAEAIRNTAKDENKRSGLSLNGLKYVSENSWENKKSIYHGIMNHLLSNHTN